MNVKIYVKLNLNFFTCDGNSHTETVYDFVYKNHTVIKAVHHSFF